jgi:hypothetical protein
MGFFIVNREMSQNDPGFLEQCTIKASLILLLRSSADFKLLHTNNKKWGKNRELLSDLLGYAQNRNCHNRVTE